MTERICKWCKKVIINPSANSQKYHKDCIPERMKYYFQKRNSEPERIKKVSAYHKLRIKKNPNYFKNHKPNKNLIVIKSTNSRFKKDEKCAICGSTNRLEFHHWIYRMPVQRQDFSTLCKQCHTAIHYKPFISKIGDVQQSQEEKNDNN